MKFNSKITLTLALLSLMLGVGTASAWCAMKIGEASLEGVSQPETNPTKKLAGKPANESELKEFTPVNEKAIIKKIKEAIDETDNNNKKENKKNKEKDAESAKDEKKQPDTTEQVSVNNSQFPLKTRDGDVILEVVKASQQGDSLVLDVSLSNQGEQSVQFVYDLLEVKDTASRPISATVENLPQELPANGKTFSGTVKIPADIIKSEERISLNLTDYPEQKLNLSIANIPLK